MRGFISQPPRRTFAARGCCLQFLLVSFAWFVSGCASVPQSAAPGPLSVVPAVVDFNSVVIGQKNSQTVTLTNISASPVDLNSIHISGAGFLLSSAKHPVSLVPGGKATISVAFCPTSTASVAGALTITSANLKTPLKVALSGTGEKASPALQAAPASINFGTRATSSSNFQTVNLKNTGNVALKIQSLSLSNSAFSVSGVSPGVSLAPDQKLSFQVWFRPTTSGSWSTSVSVFASSLSSPVKLTLSGAATSNSTAQTPSNAALHSVALDWNATASSVAGYHVYRGQFSGGPYNRVDDSLITSVNYSDFAVQSGIRYFYVVTAVESDGDESAFSNEVSAEIPN